MAFFSWIIFCCCCCSKPITIFLLFRTYPASCTWCFCQWVPTAIHHSADSVLLPLPDKKWIVPVACILLPARQCYHFFCVIYTSLLWRNIRNHCTCYHNVYMCRKPKSIIFQVLKVVTQLTCKHSLDQEGIMIPRISDICQLAPRAVKKTQVLTGMNEQEGCIWEMWSTHNKVSAAFCPVLTTLFQKKTWTYWRES